MKYILVVLGIVGLYSCSPTRQLKKCEKCYSLLDTSSTLHITDSIAITYDTLPYYFGVPKDSVIGRLEIVCDSTGKASIKSSEIKKGNRSDLNTSLSNNVLSIKATCDKVVDSLQLVITNKERHRSERKTNFVKAPVPVEAKLKWWDRFKINWGGYAIGFTLFIWFLLLIYGGYKALSIYYKANTPMGLILMLRRKLMR